MNLTLVLHRNYSITDRLGFPGIIPVLPRQFSITLDIRSVQPPALVLPPARSCILGAWRLRRGRGLVYVREFLGRYLLDWPHQLSRAETNPEAKLDSAHLSSQAVCRHVSTTSRASRAIYLAIRYPEVSR